MSPDENPDLPFLHRPISALLSFRRRRKELNRTSVIAGRFLALAEGRLASGIDPAHPFARHEVEDLRRRLDELRHPR